MAQQIDIAVLAAGTSTRTGTRNKLLLNYINKSLINHVVNVALSSKANTVHVVLGHQSKLIEKELENLPIVTLYNKYYRTGIASSIRCAINAMSSKTDAIIFCLADMPWVSKDHIDLLVDNFKEDAICALYFNHQRGHPILFPKTWFNMLKNLEGDSGATNLLRANNPKIVKIASPDEAILQDIDLLTDLHNN